MTLIVFSKDRALQLDAFLQSYRDQVIPLAPVHVMYAASSARHAATYAEVFRTHDFAVPCSQAHFKRDLLDLLPLTGCVIFFVDDQVFVRPWRITETPGLSLRLAPHLNWCYPLDCAQPLPAFRDEELDLVSWAWTEGQYDWAYPLSVDGHVFDVDEIRPLIEATAFTSPNSLEAGLQQFCHRFERRRGLCYRESKVVNIPWTRVQTENGNRYGGKTIDSLLMLWETGSRIDVTRFYGIHNVSAHQEFPLMLKDRAA